MTSCVHKAFLESMSLSDHSSRQTSHTHQVIRFTLNNLPYQQEILENTKYWSYGYT